MTIEEAAATSRDDGGAIGNVVVRDYFGRGHQLRPGPQIYLGEQLDTGSEIFAHFHDVDQFQVVVRGSGRFGRVPVRPVTVQYADAFAPYGPIVAAKGGIGFFVFRRCAATGGWRMPGHAQMIPKPMGRRFFIDVADTESRPGEAEAMHEVLRDPDDDGLAIELIRMGPFATSSSPRGDAGEQHLLVCAGSLTRAGKKLPPLSALVPDPEELAPALAASDEGAVVLVLKFPRATGRAGSDPAKVRHDGSGYVRAVNNA